MQIREISRRSISGHNGRVGGHPESFLYVSTAARAVAAEGSSPPILRAAEVDDCAALVQYMSDHRAVQVVVV